MPSSSSYHFATTCSSWPTDWSASTRRTIARKQSRSTQTPSASISPPLQLPPRSSAASVCIGLLGSRSSPQLFCTCFWNVVYWAAYPERCRTRLRAFVSHGSRVHNHRSLLLRKRFCIYYVCGSLETLGFKSATVCPGLNSSLCCRKVKAYTEEEEWT